MLDGDSPSSHLNFFSIDPHQIAEVHRLDGRRHPPFANLHVLAHHGNHEIEKTDGLNESEAKNGVGEELTTHGGVAGDTLEEGSEDETDTDTSTAETNGGVTHTHVLRDLDHGVGDLGAVLAGGLGGLLHRAHVGSDEALALDGLEGGCRGLGGSFNWVSMALSRGIEMKF